MTQRHAYLVAGSRPWHRGAFYDALKKIPGKWFFIYSPNQLTLKYLTTIRPRTCFFVHWSSRVPAAIVQRYECVGFHMTDVPYGRGGSPLQNLILRGHQRTKLTALRMTDQLDAGPVYLKETLKLTGSAEDIFRRQSQTSVRMIRRILRERPQPVPQTGRVVRFRRRRPEESRIPPLHTSRRLYDFIRMLDAEGYPKAFVRHNGFRLEFSKARVRKKRLTAHVEIQIEKGSCK